MVSANLAWNLVNFRSGIIQSLLRSGYRVMAVAPYDAEWTPKLVAMGCYCENIRLDASGTSPLAEMASLFTIMRLMRRHRPVAWLSWTIKPNVYGALVARLNGAAAFPNVSGLGTVFIRRNWLTVIASWLYRVAFARCPSVFFQNQDDTNLFLELGLVKPHQARILPGSGIDLVHFTANLPAESATHPPQRQKFLMVSRLLADKGLREYVAAARALRDQFPAATFALIGPVVTDNITAISQSELDGWIAEGVIHYFPPVDDVRPAISASDWIVLPSYREGLSRVLLEAAAMARPIVTSDAPGCRDIVQDGVNGFLAQPRDADSLTDALRKAATIPETKWRAMASHNRHLAETSYSQERVIALYKKALADAHVAIP